jgi:hypothetical protein
MKLALAIVFLWVGCALLTVAFNKSFTKNLRTAGGSPTDVIHALQSMATAQNSAYDAAGSGAASGLTSV